MNSLLLVSHVLLWLTVFVLAILLLALMRQVGSLLLRIGPGESLDAGVGPEVGETAPWVPDGQLAKQLEVVDLTSLIFVSTSCGACEELVPALNVASSDYSDKVAFVVVGREPVTQLESWAREHRLSAPILSSISAFQSYGIDGTPYAFVVDGAGRVAARGGVNHMEHLESLLRSCHASSSQGESNAANERVAEGASSAN